MTMHKFAKVFLLFSCIAINFVHNSSAQDTTNLSEQKISPTFFQPVKERWRDIPQWKKLTTIATALAIVGGSWYLIRDTSKPKESSDSIVPKQNDSSKDDPLPRSLSTKVIKDNAQSISRELLRKLKKKDSQNSTDYYFPENFSEFVKDKKNTVIFLEKTFKEKNITFSKNYLSTCAAIIHHMLNNSDDLTGLIAGAS